MSNLRKAAGGIVGRIGPVNKVLDKGYRTLKQARMKLGGPPVEVLMDEEVGKYLKPGQKTVLYVGRRYDYGNRFLGLSFQHYNLYHALLNMDYSLVCFDCDRLMQQYGAAKMALMLREAVYYYQPDILFCFDPGDVIAHTVLKEISGELPTRTIIWLADDSYQYEATRPVWELFNLVVTTEKTGYEQRRGEGFDNVFLSQWACNHFLYKNLNLPRVHDVSFVGRCHGDRRSFVETLRSQGIDILTLGIGWGQGRRLSQSDLIRIYNQSKISLNISNISQGGGYEIKAREFEVTGCGSLLLNKEMEEMAAYFTPGEEIVTYQDAADAAEKIKYYLSHEDEREKIARRGYERILKEHTYEKRLRDIFNFALKT